MGVNTSKQTLCCGRCQSLAQNKDGYFTFVPGKPLYVSADGSIRKINLACHWTEKITNVNENVIQFKVRGKNVYAACQNCIQETNSNPNIFSHHQPRVNTAMII